MADGSAKQKKTGTPVEDMSFVQLEAHVRKHGRVEVEETPEEETPEEETAEEASEEETPEEDAPEEDASEEASEEETPEGGAPEEDAPEKDASEKDASGEETPEERPRKKKSAQQRINEITKQRHDAVREADELRRRLATLEAAQKPEDLTGAAEEATAENKAPDPKDFDFGEIDPRYTQAIVDFQVRETLKTERKKADETRQVDAAARQAREYQQKWEAQTKVGASKYDDFQVVVVEGAAAGTWDLSADMASMILDSDVGPDIAYHLASNPEEARDIAALSPLKQAAQFGRLEARFSSAEDAPKPKKNITKAPKPPTKMRGGGGRFAKGPEDMTFTELEAYYKNQK